MCVCVWIISSKQYIMDNLVFIAILQAPIAGIIYQMYVESLISKKKSTLRACQNPVGYELQRSWSSTRASKKISRGLKRSRNSEKPPSHCRHVREFINQRAWTTQATNQSTKKLYNTFSLFNYLYLLQIHNANRQIYKLIENYFGWYPYCYTFHFI